MCRPRSGGAMTSTGSMAEHSPTSTPTWSSPRISVQCVPLMVHGRRRAQPPRLSGRGPHHRPPHPRRRIRLHPRDRASHRARDRGGSHRQRATGATGRSSRPGCGPSTPASVAVGMDGSAFYAWTLGARDDQCRRRRPTPRQTRSSVLSDHLGGDPRRTTGAHRGRPVRLRPAAAQHLAQGLMRSGQLPAGVPVIAVDANASWARPGTRLVDGIEELAGHLHPSQPADARVPVAAAASTGP